MWVYQAVTNVGVQVLVLMGLGYLFARFKFLEQGKFLPQSNFIVLMLALPAFNLYLMGIKLDLQNPEPWKSLAAFLLWVFVTQACIVAYTWRFCGGDAGEAAVINMVLLMDNYAITGLLALNATVGTKWGTLALLMAMGFFLVIFPFSLAAFEWEKWAVQEHVEAVVEAAAMDIEAATAAAAAAEEASADGGGSSRDDVDGKPPPPPPPPDASGPSAQPPLLDAEQPADARQPPPLPPSGSYGPGVGGMSGFARGGQRADLADVELTLQPGMKEPPASAPPSAGPRAPVAPAFVNAAVKAARERGPLAPAAPGQGAHGFPHESRYCWWSNEDYVPARPLLLGADGGATTSSSALQHFPQRRATAAAFMPQQSTSQRRRQRQELLQQQLTGSYVPPPLMPTTAAAPTAAAAPSTEAAAIAALVSPFQASALIEWPNGAPEAQGLPAGPQGGLGGGGAYPGTAPPSAGVRRPATMSSVPSGAVTPRGRGGRATGLVERRGGSILSSMFDRLAAAGSGQLPAALFGELGGGPTTVASLPEPEKPRLQDLEFALTHQISGGTARQLARISRGYTAAAAAATAAAASPDANVRRMLLTGGGRGPQQLPSSFPTSRLAQEALGPVAATATATGEAAPPPPAATGTSPPKASIGVPIPGFPERRSRAVLQPPPSPSTGTGVSAGSAGAAGGGGGGGGSTGTSPAAPLPSALVSLESGNSIGPSAGALLGFPESAEEENDEAAEPKAEASTTALPAPAAAAAAAPAAAAGALACPTQSGQAAIGAAAAVPSAPASPRLWQPAPPAATSAADERLSSTSMPIFSFGRRSARRLATTAAGVTGAGARGEGGGGGAEWTPRRGMGLVQRSASDTGQVDRMLLKLASGLALDSAKRRTRTGLLVDTDPNMLLQLVDAAAVSDLGPEGLTSRERDWGRDADRQLVREATKEALRRHGGVAGAFAAFVSGHPQLWHIVSTLARNPMIWTMFIAMLVSVSGLRVFLDPASPRYRPEVGWVAGSLSWINGLVVPMSIFSNGAWMYGKPVLPKGEVTKMVVLLLIKVGVLPLLMAGCALLLRLDGMHVAAMTVLTLSPAAAASFVLAVQYGRGVELVSLTNIIGNVFLTPLLIMWLKILTALQVDFRLHDDA
ncbi:hypothetical protein PLESTB_000252500 [Pleodorina starrii]|uniref:Auxin efflux carrier component n=1 Tax=Pleodorina starrii TaxID=330485 RepID=A0A9W6BD42_9CHLO|nr:hypothetical protein PLESTM_000474000 [Pleodorina starrii]GLC49538.1 hypothetical protein PLESTB_000252500 [Pleodorina starrii]